MEALTAQTLIGGDRSLAKRFIKAGFLEEFPLGTKLFEQGQPDNDLYLILSGEVQIAVNGRVVASRAAGTHVGEMAVVDHLAKRSATVLAGEPTVTLRLSEHQFSALADEHPHLWRRVAVEVAKRLRERNRFFRPPNAQPVLFIGSSSEGLRVAEGVEQYFVGQPVVAKLWSEGVFAASQTAIESLIELASSIDFAVLVFTADDVTLSRGTSVASPRDNVVFELGLLMGAIGRNRVFILKPKGLNIRIPSDLLGVTWLEYRRAGPTSWRARVRPACDKVMEVIVRRGPR